MGNLVFTTDVHLNFCSDVQIKAFCDSILAREPTAVVIGGDISEAPDLEYHLSLMKFHLGGTPAYFVCGNHDYYNGCIADVREGLRRRYKTGDMVWLAEAGVVSLGPGAALVGHDGWYDGGYPEKNGDWFSSHLEMSDYHIIAELSSPACVNRHLRYDAIQRLSAEGAKHIRKYLPEAFKTHDKVFYMQHVSPFAETSCGPDGKMSDRDWMPHFCSRRSGEAILEVMDNQPANKELIVLCGHSHTMAWHRPRPNIYAYCGQAQYRKPKVAEQFSY